VSLGCQCDSPAGSPPDFVFLAFNSIHSIVRVMGSGENKKLVLVLFW
jgi:hypothetical protein